MVAHLVRLKLSLLRNGLRRSPLQVVGLVIAGVYGLGVLVVLGGGLVALSTADPGLRGQVLTVGGTVLVAGWWLVPLVAFGVDATLDPARFAPFPIRRRDLVVGLALAGVVGVPGAVTTLLGLASTVVWWDRPAAAVVALLGALLAVATCVVGSRTLVAAAGPVLERRRVRESLGVLALLALVAVGPTIGRLTAAGSQDLAGLGRVAAVAGWTPFGLPWAASADAAAGRWDLAAVRLLLAAGVLVLLTWVWSRALAGSFVVARGSAPAARDRGLGWFGRLPATPTGAVAARCLTYWLRDPRYAMAVAVVPVVPVLIVVAGPVRSMVLLSAPAAGFVIGWCISADVAYDGSAFWQHVAAPLPGRADRWGRALVAVALGASGVLLLGVAAALVAGRTDLLPVTLGVGLGLLLAAAGVASVTSALVVYRVQQSGESPFGTRQGASMAAVTSQLAGWAATGALSVPTLALGVAALVRHSALLGWLTLVVGPAVGAVVLVAGVRLGGAALERRAPDLLTTLRSFT